MAERNALRAGQPQDAGNKDPFAELTRIIGFDPRVKILKPAEAARPKAAPPSAPPADRADEWEAEFANADFGLKPAAPPAAPAPEQPEPAAAAPRQPISPPAVPEGAEGPASPAPAPADVASFETAEEIDDITAAFEREWHAKAVWTPTAQAVAMTPPATAGDAFDGEAEASEFGLARAGEGEGAADEFGLDLDDALAASMEQLELEDGWLDEAAAAVEDRELQPADAADAVPETAAAALAVPASEPLGFEEELAALLGGTDAPRGQPAAPQPAPVRGEPAPVPRAPTAAERNDEPAAAERTAPRVEAERVAPARAETRPAPSRHEPDPDDDPFAALAAMAARYRAGQTAPKPFRNPEPAVPAAAPPAPAAAAEPKQEPEAEPMKRPSSVRYDTPEIDTVDLPEHPVAVADDLDIPASAFGAEQEARPGRARYSEFDDEFDDLIQEMSSGERAIQPRQAAAPRTSAYAPAPRQAAPRPAMPRAATISETAHRRPAPAQPAFDQDWDDYAAPARADAGYEDSDADFDEERFAAPAAKPERKRGRWFAALFGSVALVGAGGAYALKFTGAAESGGPVLVKADASPLKVRPENPGGATVPNQENQVYDRVAGLGNTAAPQEKLLSSAEEPVSLDEPEEASDETLPGLELSGDDMGMEDMGLENTGPEDKGSEPAAGSDERVEASAADGQAPASDDAIAVAPRKVRTMVVKPDGTLAPREEATPAVQALASNAAGVIDTVRKNSEAAGVDMNESTASVTPSSGNDAVAGPASAGSDDLSAAQPAVAQPTGEWTVQIASQPSEAGARSSYSDLAKRYAAVLSGRPASIVKAEVAGKGTVWRVRVAAEDRSEAAALCTSYKAAGGSCFVTK